MDSAPLKILVVDDVPVKRQLLARLLQKDYSVLEAENGATALHMAFEHRPDLILLDVMMPDMNGYEVIRHLKNDARTAQIEVIFITGLDSPEDEARGLKVGASDYISTPFDAEVVRARVALQLRTLQQRRILEALAHVDELTAIPNRRCLDRTLRAELSRAGRSGQPISLAMLDVDHFKQYNDHYGHGMGDRVLQAIATVLHDGLQRPGDLAARYGGEEFVLVLPDTPLSGACAVARRLLQAIEALQIRHECSPVSPHVTVSIGVVSTAGLYPLITPEALMSRADACLYLAKAEGRNRVVSE